MSEYLLKNGALANATRAMKQNGIGGLSSEGGVASFLKLLYDGESVLATINAIRKRRLEKVSDDRISKRTLDKDIPNHQTRLLCNLELTLLNLAAPALREVLLLLAPIPSQELS